VSELASNHAAKYDATDTSRHEKASSVTGKKVLLVFYNDKQQKQLVTVIY